MPYVGKKATNVVDVSETQSLTVDDNLTTPAINGGQIGGRRNLVTNGAITINQRGDQTGVTSTTYVTDRIQHILGTAGTWSISKSSDAPDGFSNSLKLDCTTANSSLSSDSIYILGQKFEGQDLQHLDYGTSGAKKLTLSFFVKSNKTGTYVVEFFQDGNSRQQSQTYTIDSADTWEKKTITIDGDTSGSLANDNTSELAFYWWVVAGSDYSSGTLNTSWASSTNANRAVGIVNLADSTSNEWYVTGVQLEVGSVATEFEHRSFGEELALCQRYYEKNYPQGTAPASSSTLSKGSFVVHSSATITYRWSQQFKVTKRAAPTSVIYSTTGASGNVRLSNASDLAVTIEDSGDSGFAVYALNRSSTGGEFYWWNWVADAEL
jgi:hypothetical protein